MKKKMYLALLIIISFSSVAFAESSITTTLADFLGLSHNNIVSVTLHRIPYTTFETRTTSDPQQISSFLSIAESISMTKVQGDRGITMGSGSGDIYIEVKKKDGTQSYGYINMNGGVDGYNMLMNRPPVILFQVNEPKKLNDICFSISSNISDWAQNDVNTAWMLGITSQNEFSNYKVNITREQFCDEIVNLLKLSNQKQLNAPVDCPFVDTKSENVAILWNNKIVSGKSETAFAPFHVLTREESATILDRAYSLLGLSSTTGDYSFSDDSDISDWAKVGVYDMQQAGIMKGIGNDMFAPKSNYTVEQATSSLLRLYNKYSKSYKAFKVLDSNGNLILSAKDITKCTAVQNYNNTDYGIEFWLTADGTNKLSAATGRLAKYSINGSNYLEMYVNNAVISKAGVLARLDSNSIIFQGALSLNQATQFIDIINAEINN